MVRSAACGAEVDAQLPVMGEELGSRWVRASIATRFPGAARTKRMSYAIAPQWRPNENFELRPFFSHIKFSDEESEPLMLTAGGVMPPKIEREHYYGQSWATNEGEVLNYGVIGAARFGDWTARLGLFESVLRAGCAIRRAVHGHRHRTAMRTKRSWHFPTRDSLRNRASCACRACSRSGARRHTLQFAARGRLQKRRYGGEDVIDVGPVVARRRSRTSRGRSSSSASSRTTK